MLQENKNISIQCRVSLIFISSRWECCASFNIEIKMKNCAVTTQSHAIRLIVQVNNFVWSSVYITIPFANKSSQRLPDSPYVRIRECLVSYLCLDYECKIGHSDPIVVKCERNVSCNLLSIHTNSTRFGISKTTRTKINRIKTHYISMCTKFEERILIYAATNAEQGHSFVPLELLWQGTKSLSHPGLPGYNEAGSPVMATDSAYMDTDSAYCGSVIGQTRSNL